METTNYFVLIHIIIPENANILCRKLIYSYNNAYITEINYSSGCKICIKVTVIWPTKWNVSINSTSSPAA